MDTTLCGLSAFQFHRIPPVVRACIDSELDLTTHRGRYLLGRQDRFLGYLTLPLTLLVQDQLQRHSADSVVFKYWNGDLPFGAKMDVESGFCVTDPLFTLAILARDLNDYELMMAMYELCGRFSCIDVTGEHLERAEELRNASGFTDGSGWSVVKDVRSGKATGLWMRDPLIDIDDLKLYGKKNLSGHNGSKKFARCANRILGILDSPLEVRAVMALGLPRVLGGEGYRLKLNKEITFTGRAQRLAKTASAKPDIVIEGFEGAPRLIIECQGRSVHGERGINESDSQKINALKMMDCNVLTLTHDHLATQQGYEAFMELVGKVVGRARRPKSDGMLQAEKELRKAILADWSSLGIKSCA